jgi:polysaccharide export outer membrane protein
MKASAASRALRFYGLALCLVLTASVQGQMLPQLPDPIPPPAQAPTLSPPTRSGTAAVSATVSMEVLDNSRQLSRGDIVNLRVVEDRDPPISLQINDSGDLEVPYIGRVRAEGKTPRQLAFDIKSLLQQEYYHSATVIIGLDVEGQRSPGLIYVTGMVGSPGPLQIPPNETFTVSKAILRAGGFGTFANQRKVKLTRTLPDGTTDIRVIDVKKILEKGHPDHDVEVLPNDLILVPERLINF